MNWKKTGIIAIIALLPLINEIVNYGVYDLAGAIASYLGGFLGLSLMVEIGERIYRRIRKPKQ